MSNALMVRQPDFLTLQQMSTALYKSGYFKDVTNEAQAIVKVMAGSELGLPPFASMAGIHIISGKPVLGSNLLATLIKNSGRYDYRVKACTDQECTIVWYEGGKPAGESGFTIKEAQAAGLTGKDNWKKFPSDMLFARAISRGARRFAPGIFGGAPVYTPDEMGAETDEEGYVIRSSPNPETGEIIQGEYTVEAPAVEPPKTNGKQSGPTPTPAFYMPGDEVMVRGKTDEKPGVVLEDNGNGTVLVGVGGKELKIGRDKLTLIPVQAALIPDEPAGNYSE